MTVKLLTKHRLESLSLKGGCTVSSESTHVKISHCWKSHAVAQFNNKRGVNEGTNDPPIPFYSTYMQLKLMGTLEIKQWIHDVKQHRSDVMTPY